MAIGVRFARLVPFVVVGCLTITVETSHGQVGGWSVTGTVELRGAEHRTSTIDSTLAIFDDGTYIAVGFLACGRGGGCEPGTWTQGKQGNLILQPAFPSEWDPPQQLSLARCLYNNSFLTSSTNKPKVKVYRHVLQAGDGGLFTLNTNAKLSARFIYGRTSVRAKGALAAAPIPLDDALAVLRDWDCDPADYAVGGN